MRQDDADLSRADIQALASREAIVAFFAQLGYNTNARLVQTKAAMSITAESLATQITHIERVSSDDAGGLVEIYLFELKSVTVATRQGLVRAFQYGQGDYLLVLTDDYEQIDFVLVERYNPETVKSQPLLSGLPAAPKNVRVRQRTISLNRLKPDEKVVLRVLRRFSYTEADTFAQYDKLMSAYDVAYWSEPYFNNRALFSDYYLNERLPESPEWTDKQSAAVMTVAYKELRNLYEDVREELSNAPGATVRQNLLQPVLKILGFNTQPAKKSSSAAIEPTYRLYSATSRTDTALAVCLAYAWARSLDGKDDQHDTDTPEENPGATVVALLEHGDADWAIVTNGKIWRLYAAKAHSRATNYYEIDLEETLALPASDRELAFHYFWLLFRAAAFVPTERIVGGETRSLSFLDNLLAESGRYAHDLGERLKERVFEDIFPHFAEGFITHARLNGLLPPNLEMMEDAERNHLLEPFFGGTLTFLYRLLFLLYAESRDLLPVRDVRGYYEKSLEKLRREIAEKGGSVEDQAPARIKVRSSGTTTGLYDRLQELFGAIDRGDPALNVPLYNGGLFVTQPDPTDHTPEAEVARFLASHKIPDRELALGLDRMARDVDEKTHALVAIDYKSLGVRQLGSIYEGLLEFKLRVAPEKMAIVKGKKTEEIVSFSEAQQRKLSILKLGRGRDALDRTLPRGSVYLENDKRERKATGSYYTPDHIVKYIVENTVGPVLTEKLEALRPAFHEAEKAVKAERVKFAALKRGDDPEHQAYLKHRDAVTEPFFNLRVLDPAMGSGHFLVEAVDYITDHLVEFLTGFVWNPVMYELAVTRHEIANEMERQAVTIDTGKLTDLNLLKRQVLKRCIYGVDLNLMAVELAKVSLWLDCFTLGTPLSFLDHHLKQGNSLVGAGVEEVRTAIEQGQFSLFASNLWAGALLATDSMIQVGKLSDVTAAQVIESRREYYKAVDALAPFKRILDMYTSRWFGNKVVRIKRGGTIIDLDMAVDFLRSLEAQDWLWHPNQASTLNDEQQALVATATQATQNHAFFHWQLEFPEVYFAASIPGGQDIQLRESAGFDAVIGNPPWVSYSGRQAVSLPNGYADFYYYKFHSAQGWLCTQALFIEQSALLAGDQRRFGLVVPAQVSDLDGFKAMREFLATRGEVQEPCRYHGEEAFEGVTEPAITVLFARCSGICHQAARWQIDDSSSSSVPRVLTDNEDADLERVLRRLLAMEPCGSRSFGDPGVHSGNCADDLFTRSGGLNSAPIREGRDIRPFLLLGPRVFLRLDLAPMPGQYFRIGRIEQYANCPIVLRQTASRPIAALHKEATYFRNSVLACYGIEHVAHSAVVAILNSELFGWLHRRLNRDARQKSFPQVKVGHLRALPKPPVGVTVPSQTVRDWLQTFREVLDSEVWP